MGEVAGKSKGGRLGWQQVFADNFTQNYGGTITAQEAITVGQKDFTSLLTSIASGSPEFLYYPIFTAEGALITQQAPVIFNVTSTDVMHDFGLPDFKIKIDAIPGRYNVIWIEVPSLEGHEELVYKIHCYELCGIGHTYMMANLTVMSQSAFDQWLNQTAISQAGG